MSEKSIKLMEWSENLAYLYMSAGSIMNVSEQERSEEENAELAELNKQISEDKNGFKDKADGYARVKSHLESNVIALKVERDRINKRIKANERGLESVKWFMSSAMAFLGLPKFKTALFSFSFRKSQRVEIACPVES